MGIRDFFLGDVSDNCDDVDPVEPEQPNTSTEKTKRWKPPSTLSNPETKAHRKELEERTLPIKQLDDKAYQKQQQSKNPRGIR